VSEQTSTGLAIEARGLVKRYSEGVLAIDGVDLSIPANTIYTLLGPNGAGKTTTISMLTTLIKPTAGSAQVAGFDVVCQASDVRRRIGVTFQETVLDVELTGRQVLDYHGRQYGQSKTERQSKITELLALVELAEAADRRVNTYSGGMKRRLELARGLMTEPAVLFLDEPTLGLDPQNRVGIWDYIRNLKEQRGMTLLLTTHYMDEAEKLADQIGIIDHGRIVIEGTPPELIDQMGADVIHIEGQGDVCSSKKFRRCRSCGTSNSSPSSSCRPRRMVFSSRPVILVSWRSLGLPGCWESRPTYQRRCGSFRRLRNKFICR
jgi:ABC-2 type transport system ATP-binding protein